MRRLIAASILAALVMPRPIHAESGEVLQMTVRTAACPGLDGHEVERLLALELSDLETDLARPLEVELTCSLGGTLIRVVDPLTGKRLERQIPASPTDQPGRERELALAASQLFIASWLELVREPARTDAPQDAALSARAIAERSLPGTQSTPLVGAIAGVRLRDLGNPLPSLRSGVRGGLRLGQRWEVAAEAAIEVAAAARRSGSVDLSAAHVGIVARRRVVAVGAFAIDLGAGLALGRITLEGHPSALGVVAGSSSAWASEAELAVRTRLDLSILSFGLGVGAGVTAPTAVGLVEGDEAVRPGGPWLGVQASLGARFGD